MPSRCVVFGCSNTPDPDNDIILHAIPYNGDFRPQAVARRKRWVDFVKRKRAKWEPLASSCICSNHFKADDFFHKIRLPGQDKAYAPKLKRDNIGIVSYPSILDPDDGEERSERGERAIRRKVRN